ncbi:hypothetical protein [Flammeovirga pacifica]|uniref:Uncharacterized protein n=1 Tax=Flammeovirga pacifica TaxID=915059 RepID=A0A1S1Z2S7_FLAPC|nr:hypothetical protein [Flammeovirga pacifica]OHX67588.1 hypothetical protein NH26_15140 [Flammeovirga pacifica]
MPTAYDKEEVVAATTSTTDETPQEDNGLKGTSITPIKEKQDIKKTMSTYMQSKEYKEYLETQKPVPDGFFMTGNYYAFNQRTTDFISHVEFLVLSKDYIKVAIRLTDNDGTMRDYGNDYLSFDYSEKTKTISFIAMGRTYSCPVKELKSIQK